jgi:hypothetical protein
VHPALPGPRRRRQRRPAAGRRAAFSSTARAPTPAASPSAPRTSCNGDDLDALGRKKGVNLPVIPIVNLLVTTRFMIKDTFGINITGGWQTGFYFGGSLQYFFGPK